MPVACRAIAAWFALIASADIAVAQTPAGPVAGQLAQIVRGTEGHHVGPIGLTASGRGIVGLEPSVPVLATQPRVVLVAGLDGARDGVQVVLDVVRWRLADTTIVRTRRRWQVAAVPCVLADRCDVPVGTTPAVASGTPVFPPTDGFYDAAEFRETRYLWRWVAMLAPDLVIEVRSGARLEWRANGAAAGRTGEALAADAESLAGALGAGAPSGLAPVPALQISGPPAQVTHVLREFLDGRATPSPSPLGRAFAARLARPPLTMARMLAARYPASPIMSYIPALAWSGALKLSSLTGDPQYRERAVAQMTPFLDGEKPAVTEPTLLTSLAGHLAFFDLAAAGGRPEADALARKAADLILGQRPEEIVRFATGWTDDLFMATSVLARAAARSGDTRYVDAVTRLVTTYATTLQRPDGLFIHAESGPHAWGRGNGFAAFGLMEALTHLPASWPARPQALDTFRRLMGGMRRHQAPDGAWHQVVDDAATYREFTVTAMTVAALARGRRLGWLDPGFDAALERGWRAVQARVTETGELVDVCSGTGAGRNATGEYYRQRPAVTGADDRGGAMALTAALEMHALRTP